MNELQPQVLANLEQTKKMKPLEHLLKAKTALLVELEMELCHPRLTPHHRRLIEEKRDQVKVQTDQITKLIQGIDPVSSVAEPETQAEEIPTFLKTGVAIAFGFMMGVGLMTAINPVLNPSVKTTSTEMVSPPVVKVERKNQVPSFLTIDAANAFEVNSLALNPGFIKKIENEILGKIVSSSQKVEIEVHSKIMPGSPRSPSSMKFVKSLTQKRADSVVRDLQALPALKGISFIPVGMGEEAGIGKKIVVRFHDES